MEAAGHADISLILYARASGDKRVGDVKSVSFATLPAQAASVRFLTKSGDSVTLPASAIKLADGVLRDNTDMIKVTVNVALKYIGQEAFCGSALTTVMYNGSQENSSLVSVGKNAFADTPWYTATENVIIGTIDSIQMDLDNWNLVSMKVKLDKTAYAPLDIKKGLLGKKVSGLLMTDIAEITDVIRLNLSILEVKSQVIID